MSARPETWKTMVRPGIALYGYSLAFTRGGAPATGRGIAAAAGAFVEDASAHGEGGRGRQAVGYMGTFVTKTQSRIAVLPVGYADGYPRLLSNRARVIVRGEYAPVVGRVSMDLTIVDVRTFAASPWVMRSFDRYQQWQDRRCGRAGTAVRKCALRNFVRAVAEGSEGLQQLAVRVSKKMTSYRITDWRLARAAYFGWLGGDARRSTTRS